MRAHLIIPDTQVKPGVPMDHLRWAGLYIEERRPDVVIHLGDHWDMESLSSWDKGKLDMEGRRYNADIDAGNEGMELLTAPSRATLKAERRRKGGWRPSFIRLLGNHENRVDRYVQENGHLHEALGTHHMESPGWTTVDFLEPVWLDGVCYSHYFYNPMTGRPYGGANVETRTKTIGHSFTMGHQQGLKFGMVESIGGTHYGLVAGSFYLHDEKYLGPQGNAGWRGLIVKHEVENGTYAPMFVTLNYLCRRYEGMSVREFLRANYPDHTGVLWR